MRPLSISAITKQIQSSLFYINRFCNDTVTIAQSAIQHRPSNRIDFRNLLHRISTDTHDHHQNGNYLARQLLLLDKEIVYLEYEGFKPFLLKKIHLLKIKYYGNGGNINIQNGEIGTETENESESHINNVPIRSANADKSETKVGKIAFMITKQQKNILGQELLYTQTQIKSFKPIEALLIVEHGLIMNGDIDNNYGAAVAINDGGIDTSNASESTANGNDNAAHWRHELDRLLMENDQIMDQQQQQQKEQQQEEEEVMQANMQIQETLKRQQKEKESRHDDSTNALQNTTSSVLLGFEQPLAPNFAPSTRYAHDNDNKDKSYALAIVTDSVNDNGGGFPSHVSTAVSTEATASEPFSETEANSYTSDSGRHEAQNTKEVGWYEVVQFSKLSVAASSHSTQVVALYRTRKEAEEFLDIKTELIQKRLEQKNGRSGDDYEQGIDYRVQKRK